MYGTYQGGRRVKDLAREINELKIEEGQLKQTLEYRKSGEFVEQQARDKLNLIKPGDTVGILNPRGLGSEAQDSDSVRNLALPVYRQWFRLFFD